MCADEKDRQETPQNVVDIVKRHCLHLRALIQVCHPCLALRTSKRARYTLELSLDLLSPASRRPFTSVAIARPPSRIQVGSLYYGTPLLL